MRDVYSCFSHCRKATLWTADRHNGFEDFKSKKCGVQNLHLPVTVAKWQEMMIERMGFARTGEVKSSYRGYQTLVQGRSNLRTGEIESPYRGQTESLEGSFEV